MKQFDGEASTDKEVVITVNRVSRTVQGGRRMRFQALVVVGDGDKKVGLGIAKALDVQTAVQKAIRKAKKAQVTININDNFSIAHEVESKKDGAKILLKPAVLGTGVKAGGTTRSVLSVTGIQNILAKSLGSSNKANVAYATINALLKVQEKSQWVTTKQTRSLKKTAEIKRAATKKVKLA